MSEVGLRSRNAVQHLLGAPVVAGEGSGAGLRRGARADRERRPARVRHVLGDRALLLPEVLGVAGSDRALHRRGPADEADQLPHARPRAAVPQPDGAGLADRQRRRPHRRPVRVRRRPRARLDPLARGDRLLRDGRALRRVARDPLQGARAGGEPFDYDGKFFQIHDARIVPPPTRKFRVFTGGTSDKTYILAGTNGWGVVVPPLLPYEALREQLDLYRATCAEHGNEPDIVWIHACYLDEDRDTAIREAEEGIKGFLAGNASPLVEHRSRRPTT